jgi:sortase A
MRWARVLGVVGRVFITAGVLILLFVAYQLWGTGIREAQSQRSLKNEFAQRVDGDSPGGTTTTIPGATVPPTVVPSVATTVAEGDAVAHIQIPAIGVDKIVVEGVGVPDLKKGPGHYPGSPLPGQKGNAAIAGHRTTYGAPFNRIDELKAGDQITVTTVQGTFHYEVRKHLVVKPNQTEVLKDYHDDRLTLTSCNPKYSARQRIVVVSALTGAPAPTPPDQVTQTSPNASTLDAGLSGERASAWPAIFLFLACALIWVAAWLFGKLWAKWPAYAVCLPLFLIVLFFFFENFSRLLPANF